MKKTISIILATLAILIFIVSITIMFIGTRALRDNEPLYIFGYSLSIVPTDSMVGEAMDSIDPFDIVILKKSSFEMVEINNVVVFQGEVNGNPALLIHRVVGYHLDGGFETKGDNNTSPDELPLTEDNFKGIYQSKITFLKPIASLATNSRNIVFAALSLVLLIMILTEVIHIIKTYQKEKEQDLITKHNDQINQMRMLDKEKIYQEILDEEKKKNNVNDKVK